MIDNVNHDYIKPISTIAHSTLFIVTKIFGSDIIPSSNFTDDQPPTDEVWSECHLSKDGWVQTKLCYGCTETQNCSKFSFVNIVLVGKQEIDEWKL